MNKNQQSFNHCARIYDNTLPFEYDAYNECTKCNKQGDSEEFNEDGICKDCDTDNWHTEGDF